MRNQPTTPTSELFLECVDQRAIVFLLEPLRDGPARWLVVAAQNAAYGILVYPNGKQQETVISMSCACCKHDTKYLVRMYRGT